MSQHEQPEYKGWLYKWTNYIKGYQRRYFTLTNGVLSYYRSNIEIPHTCRGSINLQSAFIDTIDSTSFVVTNGGAQTFHLKAASEVDRQKWVTALELAKAKSIRELESDDEDQNHVIMSKYSDLKHSIKLPLKTKGSNSLSTIASNTLMNALTSKLEDLITCDDLISKHGTALQKAIVDLESSLNSTLKNSILPLESSNENKPMNKTGKSNISSHDLQKKDVTVLNNPNDIMNTNPSSQFSNTLGVKIKNVNERATLFKITANAVTNACAEYLELAQLQTKKWQKLIQHEREQKAGLEEIIEQLAKQHSHLEKAAARNMAVSMVSSTANITSPAKQNVSDEDEFFDANDVDAIAAAAHPLSEEEGFVVTLPRLTKGYHHRRTPSGMSNISEGAHGKSNNSSESSDKEADMQEATVFQTKNIDISNHSHKNVKNEFSSEETLSDSEKAPAISRNALQQLHHLKPDYALSIDKALLINLKNGLKHPRLRRSSILPKPNMSLNLWSIIKNCIGKDLSKIPMPVNFSEPLSMLQRLTEDFEYSEILNKAALIKDAKEQMCYVAAFTVSSYSTTVYRTSKPFNPLLGETFECDRSDDKGWIMISEQVSHHPPTAAFYTESEEWVCWQEFTMSSKFRGKYLNIIPLGIAHLEFKKSGNHYTWRKVTSTVHNIIVGKLWMEHSGEMDIVNHKTNDNCHLKYYSYSYFTREPPRKVTGVVTDQKGNAHWVLSGNWDTSMECAKVVDSDVSDKEKPILETLPPLLLWRVQIPPAQNECMYYFTRFALQLNEMEPNIAPTDSRNRPDQRLLENGEWEKANIVKLKLEEKQRNTRRMQENLMEKAANEGKTYKNYEPIWFKKQQDPYTGNLIHLYKGQYFTKKAENDWTECSDIFEIVT